MTTAVLALRSEPGSPDGLRLCLQCDELGIREARDWRPADAGRVTAFRQEYDACLRQRHPEAALLGLGRALYRFLDELGGALTRLDEQAAPPLRFEVRVPLRASPAVAGFCELPVELLAGPRGFWAADATLQFAPVRRLGEPAEPPPPARHRLGLLFMAAAPEHVAELEYEYEEAAILEATQAVGLDLIVEESGNLEQLTARFARHRPVEVVHLSGHGDGATAPETCLVLEDEVGQRDPCGADKLGAACEPARPSGGGQPGGGARRPRRSPRRRLRPDSCGCGRSATTWSARDVLASGYSRCRVRGGWPQTAAASARKPVPRLGGGPVGWWRRGAIHRALLRGALDVRVARRRLRPACGG